MKSSAQPLSTSRSKPKSSTTPRKTKFTARQHASRLVSKPSPSKRKPQTLSDLLSSHLFPAHHRSTADLVRLHQSTATSLCSAISSHPLSPHSISLFSLHQLHKAHHQLKCLQLVLASYTDTTPSSKKDYNSLSPSATPRPPSLPTKYQPTTLSPHLVSRADSSLFIHIPPQTTIPSSPTPTSHSTTFPLSDLNHLLDILTSHTIPTSLLPLVEVIDEHYFDSHLNSIMHFNSSYSSVISDSREYRAVFATNSKLSLPNPLALSQPSSPSSHAAAAPPSSSSHFARNPSPSPSPRASKPTSSSSHSLPLLPYINSLQHSEQITHHATLRTPSFAHLKPPSSPSVSSTTPATTTVLSTASSNPLHVATNIDLDPLRPSVDIHVTEQPTSSLSVASFTASYSVVKPQARASHTSSTTTRGKKGNASFDSSFFNLSPLGFSLPKSLSPGSSSLSTTPRKPTTKTKSKSATTSKPVTSSPSAPKSTSKSLPKATSTLATKLTAKSKSTTKQAAKSKPRSSTMSRERQGFFEFAFLPPIIAPHHAALAAKHLARLQRNHLPAETPSSPNHESPVQSLPSPPSQIVYTEAGAKSPERETDNRNFFKNYPTSSTFRLTFNRHSIRSLFVNRPILSPIQHHAIESMLNQPTTLLPPSPPPINRRGDPTTFAHGTTTTTSTTTTVTTKPLSYSDLILAYSERRRCIAPPMLLADITLLDCPSLLVHFNAILSTILSSLPPTTLAEAESRLTRGPALCSSPSAEQAILSNAFNYTFNNYNRAETPRNLKMTKDELQRRFIDAIYLPDPSSTPTIVTTNTDNLNSHNTTDNDRDLLFHVQGLPIISGLQGIMSILQHELLHAAIFIHAPQLWTTTTDRPTNIPGPLKTTQNQRQILDLVQHRYQYALDRLPASPSTLVSQHALPTSSQTAPLSLNFDTTTPTPAQGQWHGNILPSLLKTKTPNYFWPRQSTLETPLTWKSQSLTALSHSSNLDLGTASESDSEASPSPTKRPYRTNLSSHQDGHSLAFRLLARNLFGHNKINVSLDTRSSFLRR